MYRHRLAERNLDTDHYPMVAHCMNQNHVTDWENVHILLTESHPTKRLLKESYFINKEKKPLSTHKSAYDLVKFLIIFLIKLIALAIKEISKFLP